MKILFVSLGCDKNLVDTEYMLGILGNEGYAFTDDEQEADIIVINTCCFINDAKEESINTILEMAEYRESGNCKALIVTGCLAQRYQEEIEKEISQVDAILGTNSYDAIAEAVKNVFLYASNDLKGLIVNGNGVGEGAADINSDTDFHKAKTSCFSIPM